MENVKFRKNDLNLQQIGIASNFSGERDFTSGVSRRELHTFTTEVQPNHLAVDVCSVENTSERRKIRAPMPRRRESSQNPKPPSRRKKKSEIL